MLYWFLVYTTWINHCCCRVTKSCLTLCCSMLGFPVIHRVPELTQTHGHRVSDATQPSHPLSSPSPPAFNLSQHQGLFQWVSSSLQVAKVLELQLSISPSNEYSGLISFRFDWFDLLGVQGPAAPQFKSISSSELSLLYGPTVTSLPDYQNNHRLDHTDLCQQSDVSAF